jgi:excisionase family DNA binding protein
MNTEQDKNTERYLSTGELMETLSISRSTVNRMVKRGLPHIRVGAVRRFPMVQVVEWLKEKTSAC